MTHNERPLADRTVSGALWLVTSRLSTRLCDLVTLIALGALLRPADFGLVAIAMTLVLIVDTIADIPVGQALLRLPEITAGHLHTALTLGLARGLLVAVALAALAWPFARLYGDSRLLALVMTLSIAPAARGLVSPRMTLFAKRMSFTRDFVMEISGKVVAMVVSVSIAALTRSYWAVAAATVTAPVAMVVISYLLAPHRISLTASEWRAFHGFLGWNSGAQFITVLNWQCDKLILGRLVSKAALGGFTLADTVSSLPGQALIAPILRPVLAAFAHFDGDVDRLRQAYARVSAAVVAVGLPPILVISILSGPLVQVLLGANWAIAVPMLKIIVLGSLARLIAAPLQPLAMALNRNKVFFTRSSWELAVKLPVMVLAVTQFGVMGAVWARLGMSFYNLAVEMELVRRLIDVHPAQQIAPLWRIFVSGALAAGVLWGGGRLLTDVHGLVPMLLGVAAVSAAGCAVYLAGLLLLWRLSGRPAGIESDQTFRFSHWLHPQARAG
jgi:PST family polysaccharide transporter